MTIYHLAAIPALLLVIAALWPVALFVVLVVAVAWLWETRRRVRGIAKAMRKYASDAQAAAAKAVDLAETFADEAKASHAANEILTVELADSDATIHRLTARLSAALAEAEHAPAPVIPFPTQRTGAHDDLAALDAEATAYTWPAVARGIEHDDLTALMRATEEER